MGSFYPHSGREISGECGTDPATLGTLTGDNRLLARLRSEWVGGCGEVGRDVGVGVGEGERDRGESDWATCGEGGKGSDVVGA